MYQISNTQILMHLYSQVTRCSMPAAWQVIVPSDFCVINVFWYALLTTLIGCLQDMPARHDYGKGLFIIWLWKTSKKRENTKEEKSTRWWRDGTMQLEQNERIINHIHAKMFGLHTVNRGDSNRTILGPWHDADDASLHPIIQPKKSLHHHYHLQMQMPFPALKNPRTLKNHATFSLAVN